MNSEEKKVNQEVTKRLLEEIGAFTPVTWEIMDVYLSNGLPIQFEASYVDVLKNMLEANVYFASDEYFNIADFIDLFPGPNLLCLDDVRVEIPGWSFQCFAGYKAPVIQNEDPTSRTEHGKLIFELRLTPLPCDGAYECCSDVYCYCD